MARLESRYVCGTCGASSLRWEGQCRSCGEWNTLVETVVRGTSDRAQEGPAPVAAPAVTPLSEISTTRLIESRWASARWIAYSAAGSSQVSLVLLGGEPGIGKSTLVLAISGAIADALPDARVLYASGEESASQLRLRAARLGLASGSAAGTIDVLPETSVGRIVAAAESTIRNF